MTFGLVHIFIRQKMLSPEDPSSNCVNYPTKQFNSFNDCYVDYIGRGLPAHPFWTAPNMRLEIPKLTKLTLRAVAGREHNQSIRLKN